MDRLTGKQFIIKLSSEDKRRRGVTITFLHGCSNEADHSAVGVGKTSPVFSSSTLWYGCYSLLLVDSDDGGIMLKGINFFSGSDSINGGRW